MAVKENRRGVNKRVWDVSLRGVLTYAGLTSAHDEIWMMFRHGGRSESDRGLSADRRNLITGLVHPMLTLFDQATYGVRL